MDRDAIELIAIGLVVMGVTIGLLWPEMGQDSVTFGIIMSTLWMVGCQQAKALGQMRRESEDENYVRF